MSIKAEKAKAMMYKKAALAELNIETILAKSKRSENNG